MRTCHYILHTYLRVVYTAAFCVRCPIRDARKLRLIRYFTRDCSWIVSTAAFVSPSVIVQIIACRTCKMRAITHAIAREKQLDTGMITDKTTDPYAFSRITDATTDAKRARGNDPLMELGSNFDQICRPWSDASQVST
jgi:hypothetical protein